MNEPDVRAGDAAGAARSADGRVLVDSLGLAVALGVSLRTVGRMLAAGEIVPVRIRGAVRFYVPDVVECLRNENRKWGRKAELQAPTSKLENSESGRAAK
jgi:hypothetical protein